MRGGARGRGPAGGCFRCGEDHFVSSCTLPADVTCHNCSENHVAIVCPHPPNFSRGPRCYTCSQYGHIAANCPLNAQRSGACYTCGSYDHRAAECPTNSLVCASCGGNHATSDCTGCAVCGRTNHPTAEHNYNIPPPRQSQGRGWSGFRGSPRGNLRGGFRGSFRGEASEERRRMDHPTQQAEALKEVEVSREVEVGGEDVDLGSQVNPHRLCTSRMFRRGMMLHQSHPRPNNLSTRTHLNSCTNLSHFTTPHHPYSTTYHRCTYPNQYNSHSRSSNNHNHNHSQLRLHRRYHNRNCKRRRTQIRWRQEPRRKCQRM